MKHFVIIEKEFIKNANTYWESLSPRVQNFYLHKHPTSKKQKTFSGVQGFHNWHTKKPKNLNEKLFNIRQQYDLTQQDLATLLSDNTNSFEKTYNDINALETGTNKPYNETSGIPTNFTPIALKIADFFNISPEELYDINLYTANKSDIDIHNENLAEQQKPNTNDIKKLLANKLTKEEIIIVNAIIKSNSQHELLNTIIQKLNINKIQAQKILNQTKEKIKNILQEEIN